ncbi:hypothetical protein [Amycolatopsis sp. BJA-103]|uniref:hypothetical protein n=1 Tax=Amycolatopsis sp. BJA-103 TaxID=1911175 RepID=UPI000C76912E|nr:hypothetical protein [Amycolatopsis sp. BJA-103]AUI61476.1 hypothetical protein BKN51_27085 [Amycolatopsis sp. BJA-103]PNE21230.1 hypothetical protein B1H26_05370 [Amycolatopsis sp. BJA-103]
MQPGPPYQQGPQQPYPPQGYPQQGYPGYPQPGYGPPQPKKSNTGLIVGLVIGAVVLLGGGGVAAFLLLSDDSGSSSAAAPTSSKKSGPPDKYTSMPGCEKIGTGVRNLPPLEPPKGEEPASTSNNEIVYTRSFCTWREPDAPSASVAMYLSKSKEPGSGAGEAWAKATIENAVDDGGVLIPTMAKSTKALYAKLDSASQCQIKFHQGNVEAEIIVTGPDPSGKVDQTKCKENALKVAKATSEAIG